MALTDSVVDSRVARMANDLLGPGTCLVHGDFSPKNLLVAPDGMVVLVDHEVAHFGDPAFDLAFCLSHLCLKAIHCVSVTSGLVDAARSFVAAYGETAGAIDRSHDRRVAALTCALMLARVDGKSPVEYLDEGERSAVRAFAIRHLRRQPAGLESLLRAVAAGP
jgi:aminoglycoside phosphotransferase (APT) family kinase protein